MDKLKFTKITDRGDGISCYNVAFPKGLTLFDLVSALKTERRWGSVRENLPENRAVAILEYDGNRVNYRNKRVFYKLSGREISDIKAIGGMGMMNYILTFCAA